MTVEISVEISDDWRDDLESLDSKLDDIDNRRLDPTLNIDDDVGTTHEKLDSLDERRTSSVHRIKTRGGHVGATLSGEEDVEDELDRVSRNRFAFIQAILQGDGRIEERLDELTGPEGTASLAAHLVGDEAADEKLDWVSRHRFAIIQAMVTGENRADEKLDAVARNRTALIDADASSAESTLSDLTEERTVDVRVEEEIDVRAPDGGRRGGFADDDRIDLDREVRVNLDGHSIEEAIEELGVPEDSLVDSDLDRDTATFKIDRARFDRIDRAGLFDERYSDDVVNFPTIRDENLPPADATEGDTKRAIRETFEIEPDITVPDVRDDDDDGRKLRSVVREVTELESEIHVPDVDRQRVSVPGEMELEIGTSRDIDIGGRGFSLPTPEFFDRDDGEMIDASEALSRSLGDIFGKLKRVIPSAHQWMNILAALVPLLITAGVATLGLAAAFGGLALAGASIIGLGLVGHANSWSDALQEAKNQVTDLGTAIFDVFAPARQALAPIQADIFRDLPGQLAPLADELAEMAVFGDLVGDMIGGFFEWMAWGADVFRNMAPVVDQLIRRFGTLAGVVIMDGFVWLIEEAARNQDLIIRLGEVLLSLGNALYTLSVIGSRVVTAMMPVFHVLNFIMDLLSNPFVAAVVTAVGTTLALSGAFLVAMSAATRLLTVLGFLGSGSILGGIVSGFKTVIGTLWSYIYSAWSAVTASTALATALSALTLGGTAILGAAAGMATFDALTDQTGLQPASASGRSPFSPGGSRNTPASQQSAPPQVDNTYVFNGEQPAENMEEFRTVADNSVQKDNQRKLNDEYTDHFN